MESPPLSGSLLDFVRARLDQIDSPVFSHVELSRFPAAALAVLQDNGILREGPGAEEITRPPRFRGGGHVAVRRTSKGIFGVAREDEPYIDPLLLTEDDVRQYEVSVDRIVDRLRLDNEIQATGYTCSSGIIALGERQIEGWGAIDAYLAVGLRDDASVLSACLHLRTETSPRRVVLLTLTSIAISAVRRRAIDATGVFVESLSGPAQRGSLAVSWSLVLGAPDVRHATRMPRELRVFQRNGASWLVTYDGQSATIAHALGMTYIQHLLEHPSTSVPAAVMAGASGRTGRARIVESATRLSKGKKPEDAAPVDHGDTELAAEEAEARRTGDQKRLGQLRQIRSLTSLDRREAKGKPSGESKADKGARQSVSAAIRRAIEKIGAKHQKLGRHLADSIEYGHSVLYKGDPSERWATEGSSA